MIEGFLLANKSVGISSFKVVRKVRAITRTQRVGHAGTLDPFASGLLVLALGRPFTRQIETVQALPKTYRLTCRLGQTTPSLDPETDVSRTDLDWAFQMQNNPDFEHQLKTVVAGFVGSYDQIPPMYSAKQQQGQRLYDLARAGKEIERKPVSVTLYRIDWEGLNWKDGFPEVSLGVTCSKGTYMRSLANDIAQQLGTVGYATALERSAVGDLALSDALGYDDLSLDSILAKLKPTL
ncbi:MAG: tRNA pseudouridine(55) synthase TruB [Candidatus Margulisiibacteriota bacterium]